MRLFVVSAFLLVALCSFGQISLGVIAEPTLNLTRVGAEPKTLSDSFKNMKSYDYTVGLGIEIRKNIDRYQSFSIIPGFHQTNILTRLEDLQLLDVVHPQLPEIRDLSFAATRNAEIRYRQMYLGSQFLYHRQLQIRGLTSKMSIQLGGGISTYFMFSQDAKVTTEAFAIQGQYTHVIKDSIGIESRPILLETLLTTDCTYQILPNTDVVAGVKIALPMTPTTSSQPKMTVWAPALRLGIRKKI